MTSLSTFCCSIILLAAAESLIGQSPVVTVAGGMPAESGSASSFSLRAVQSIGFNPQGSLFLAENWRILRFEPGNPNISVFASTQGPGSGPFAVMRIDPTGGFWVLGRDIPVVYRLSGNTPVQVFKQPCADFTFAPNGDVIMMSTTQVFRGDPATGQVTLIAGSGDPQAPRLDGVPAVNTKLSYPRVIMDAVGNLLINDEGQILRRVDANSAIITTIAGKLNFSSSTGDGGPVSDATFESIRSMSVSPKNELFLVDGPRIRKIDLTTMRIDTAVGGNPSFFTGSYLHLASDPSGTLWTFALPEGVLYSLADGVIRKEAGAVAAGDGGPASQAAISPLDLTSDTLGNLYWFEQTGVRRIDAATGTIDTVVRFALTSWLPGHLTATADGTIYYVDNSNLTIYQARPGSTFQQMRDANGELIFAHAIAADPRSSTNLLAIVGNNATGASQLSRIDVDTKIVKPVAQLGRLSAVGPMAAAPDGTVFFQSGNQVLRVGVNGSIAPFAGNGGCFYSGDGGLGVRASFCGIFQIAVNDNGDLFVADAHCQCVRRVSAETGIVNTIVGTGRSAVSPDGLLPIQTTISNLVGVAVTQGALFFSEAGTPSSGRLRKVANPIPPAGSRPPQITAVVNAASPIAGIGSGSIVSVLGHYLGPTVGAVFSLDANGRLPQSLAGTRVPINFELNPSTYLLYVAAGQINLVLPYELRTLTRITVTRAEGSSAYDEVRVVPRTLTVFPGAVLNQDHTVNSPDQPARPGSVIAIYGTGMGETSPPLPIGRVVDGEPLPKPIGNFGAAIAPQGTYAFQPTELVYFGAAPNLVAGVFRANIRLPDLPAGLYIVGITLLPPDGQGNVAGGLIQVYVAP